MVHLVLCPGRLSPLPLDRGRARGGGGGSVSGHSSVAPLSLQPLREPGRGRLLSRSGLPLPEPLPRLLLPAHHSTLGGVMSRERFQRTAPLFDPPVLPDPRIEEQGRIVELALGRTALVTVAVESVEGGHPPVSDHAASGRDLQIAPALSACALVLGETGLAETALDVTGRGLLTATDHSDSVRVPLLAGELAVTRSPSSSS